MSTDNKITFKVTPSIKDGGIELNCSTQFSHWPETLSRHFLDLKDRAVREALVALGWTPPQDPSAGTSTPRVPSQT